jgi:hypothetical protein
MDSPPLLYLHAVVDGPHFDHTLTAMVEMNGFLPSVLLFN